MKHNIWSQVTI